jgi:uncharacterized protein
MAFRILIDGYNLLFEAGFEGRGRGPGWLDRARKRLIKFLESKLPTADASKTLIVFDASGPAQGTLLDLADIAINNPPTDGGIQVVFADPSEEADDLLERLIRQHSAPKSLTVVSSDHRILKRAIARRCNAMDSSAFLTLLENGNLVESAGDGEDPPPNEAILDQNEVQRWLSEFGIINNPPNA